MSDSPWRRVAEGIADDGAKVELFYAEFGKGKAKLCKWEIYRNDRKAGYAVNQQDADVNFSRVLAGLVLNPSTGRYEPVAS